MKNSIEIFERFVEKLEKTWKGKNLLQSGIKLFDFSISQSETQSI
jgi:hypothetical protein